MVPSWNSAESVPGQRDRAAGQVWVAGLSGEGLAKPAERAKLYSEDPSDNYTEDPSVSQLEDGDD
jgi:hypothetical protein